MLGEGKSDSLGGAWTKFRGHKYEITKIMFLHSDLLKLRLKKNHNITDFFPAKIVFMFIKLALQGNKVKR